ncbi:MAG: hypothetical protein AAGF71_13965 [Pseudomonadota bacterium]
MVSAPKPKANRVLFAALLVLLVTAILDATSDWIGFAYAAGAAFLALCVVGFQTFTIRETSLLIGAIAVTGVVFVLDGSTDTLLSALDLAAFFGAFIAALTAMRDVAARSRSILAVGRYLITQPPGRRFYTTAVGGHLLGVFLNFGAVSLMSPLIQESVKDCNGAPDKDLERRQISALIRGFAWVLLWAPTTLSQAVLLTIFTEVTWSHIAPLGIGTAIVFVVIGRLYDRMEWRGVSEMDQGASPPVPWKAILTVGGLCACLIGATLIGSTATGASIALVLMIVAPLVTLVWFFAQPSQSAAGGRVSELSGVLTPSAPALARSAVALGLSGYIGRCLGQALPMESLSAVVDLSAVPGWLFLATLPVIISLGGQIALSPILLVVLLGELLRGVEALPTGQVQILFALSVGWALSMTASPNATATLLISATTRIPPTTLTWAWNLRYGFVCYLIVIAVFIVVT